MKKKSVVLTRYLFLTTLATLWGSAHTVRAASASAYGVNKFQSFTQTSDTAVVPAAGSAFTFKAFAVPTGPNSILFATAESPEGGEPMLLQSSGSEFTYEKSFASQADLDSAFPSGDYNFMFISTGGFEGPATLTLDDGSYPPTPQVSNYTAAQSIDLSKDFTLNWNSFTGATASDFVQLTVTDNSGTVLFQTGLPGKTGALAGTATSATIPANKLHAGANNAVLTFAHVTTTDTSSISGATGLAMSSKETRFTMTASGTSGPDTTAPALVGSSPANGATGVALDAPVVFTFSEPMAPSQSIIWSPNVTASKFNYTWSADGTTLTGYYGESFPTNSVITWSLARSSFKDVAGNALSSANISGTFTTSSGQSSNNPCDDTNASGGSGVFALTKSISYVQSSAAAPVLDPDQPVLVGAILNSPTNNPVTKASLQLPNGTTKVLTNFFGRSFFLSEEFPTAQAADAAYPSGSYTVILQRSSGTAQVKLNYSVTEPPTPQIANFAQTQAFDPTADFSLQWLPFTGAGNNDGINLNVHQSAGTNSFNAPDPCVPRALPNTATSITIPKNTFGSGNLQGSLSFYRSTAIDTNSVPGIPVYASVDKSTSFTFKGSGGSTGGQPQILNLVRQQSGTVTFQVKANPNATLTVQASSDLKTWAPISGGIAVGGALSVTDPQAATVPYRFYRASAQ